MHCFMSEPVPEKDVPENLPEDPEATYDPSHAASGTAHLAFGIDSEESTVARPDVSSDVAAREAASGWLPVTGRYVLLHKVGEGGFGDVWAALQTSLGRTIAVKRLKRNRGDEHSAVFPPDERHMEIMFRREAMTAAHLEHPNIVPVYDLGLDDSGQPLLAMKMLKGRLWSEVIRADFSAMGVHEFLAKHLQVLIDVGQAVAFAHSHGIVHRDLKPSQVMIGNFGEVLLMDWGLAMACRGPNMPEPSVPWARDPGSPLNNPVNPAGTPCYMAPEQTGRTVQSIGPWTDIYLLGGILYKLLTGAPPHRAPDSDATYRLAREGAVEPPERQTPDREIPPQLSSLAGKAMARIPGDRITSAEEFVERLQDYLSGADKRRESIFLSDQVKEKLRADATDYSSLAECLNMLDRAGILWPANRAAAILRQIALSRYAGTAIENRDLKLARLQAERLAPGEERDSMLEEICRLEDLQRRQDERLAQALQQARTDRDRAESLVRFLLGDLYRALKTIGRLDVIRSVTDQSLDYFNSLGETEETDQALHNRCIAYLNIGDVLSDQGKKPEAEDAFRKAMEIAQRLVAKNPSKVEWLLDLADSHDRIGLICYYQGRANEALADHTAALDIRKRILSLKPGDPRVEAGAAATRHKMGIIHWRNQELKRALGLQLEALAEFRRLARHHPEHMDYQVALGWTLSTLGNVYRDLGQLKEAVAVTREGLRIRDALANLEPANVSRLEDLLWTRGNLALILLIDGELEESLELFRKDMDTRRRLADTDPTNIVRLGGLTFPLSLIAEILFMLGRVGEAEQTIRECVDVTRSMLERDPTSTHVLGAFARQSCQLAEMLVTQESWDEAADLMTESVNTARAAAGRAPHNAMVTKVLSRVLLLQGRVDRHNGDEAGAEACWAEARGLTDTLKSAGDELDVLDARAQLALLSGKQDGAAEFLRALRRRRWVSPYLEKLCREAGIECP
jgi:serine/threonine protein kinase